MSLKTTSRRSKGRGLALEASPLDQERDDEQKESIQGIGGREGEPKESETGFWKS